MSNRSARQRLKRGDAVGVVASGFAVDRVPVEAGLERLRRMGFRVRLGDHLFARQGYLAGNDEQRAADLQAMIRDPEVRAVWFARGGYGTARILERLPWRLLARCKKLFIGYSDLTAMFNPLIARTGLVCLYGPVVSELGDGSAFHRPSLQAALKGERVSIATRRRQVLAPGKGRGRLMGGTLSVLAHLCGTRFAPDLRGAVLFLEDWGEPTYSIDRMLNQLRSAGAFRALAGVLLGGFHVPPRTHFPPDRDFLDVVREYFLPLGVPVVIDLPAGHVSRKRTLPLGATAVIDTHAGRLRFG